MSAQQTLPKPITLTRTSFSKINTWLHCPRKFRFEYIDEAPEECTPVALIFGSAIHEACEYWFKAKSYAKHHPEKGDCTLEAMMKVFTQSITDAVSLAEEMKAPLEPADTDVKELTAKAEAMLKCFIEDADQNLTIVGTEIPFEVEVAPGVIVRGYIDAIVDEGNGRYRIIELKTAGQTYGKDRLDFDLQPTAYIVAAEKLLNAHGKVDFEYWLLMKTKTPALKILPLTRSEQDKLELVQAIGDVSLAVQAGVFPRQRGYGCYGCQYQRRCSAS